MTGTLPEYKTISQQLTLKQKVGQLFMPAAFINDSEEEIRKLEKLIEKQSIGGICFFHSRASAATNFEGKKSVAYNPDSLDLLRSRIRRYQEISPIPLLIAIDAEWGLAMRVENTPKYPTAITLGALRNNEELIRKVAYNIGRDCAEAGIHWNLAPVVDCNTNPDNPVIGYRAFGEDPELVIEKARAFIRGSTESGILTCIKHYPGHGDTITDSHLGLPVLRKSMDELKNIELRPFGDLVAQGVDAVMTGHLAVPKLTSSEEIPASLSTQAIETTLRNEIGHKGVIITDALNMHAVSKRYDKPGHLEYEALKAGNDILCFPENPEAGIAMIEERNTPEKIEAHFKRVWQLKEKAMRLKSIEDYQPRFPREEVLAQIAKSSITQVKGNPAMTQSFARGKLMYRAFGKTENRKFQSTLQNKHGVDIRDSGLYTAESTTPFLVGIYPPGKKPATNFGFTTETWDELVDFLSREKTIIYLFGTPFVLNRLPLENAGAVILAYEDFVEFEIAAADHFAGKASADGVIPVSIQNLQ